MKKICTLVSFALFFIFFANSTFAQEATFQGTFKTILSPQKVTDINNQLLVGTQLPKDKIYMVIRHLGTDALATPISFDLGRYTGLSITDNPTNWQRGKYNSNEQGQTSSGFQLFGTSGGLYINTNSFDYQPVIGGGPQAVYNYEWSIDKAKKPWANLDSDLVLQADVRLPHLQQIPNSAGQVPNVQFNLYIYLWDISNPIKPKAICFVISLFDPRGSQPEIIYTDPSDMSKFASTSLSSNSKYVTVSPFSSSIKSVPWNDLAFFRVHITRQNLINVIQDYHDSTLSLNPSDYILTSAGLIVETIYVENAHISVGASFDNFAVYEFDRNSDIFPGDFNVDGKVNAVDYTLFVAGFGTQYTILDYAKLVAGYGK